MKNFVFTLLLAIAPYCFVCQNKHSSGINSIKEEKTVYKANVISGKLLYLEMGYGGSEVLNQKNLDSLIGGQILCVDILYSDYPRSWTHSNMTQRRIESLKKLNSSIRNDQSIKWRFIRQTNCVDKETAKKLFHGVVITYRPRQTKEEIKKEIAYLKELTSKLSKGTSDEVTLTTMIVTEGDFVSDSIPSFGESKIGRGIFHAGGIKFKDSTVIAVLKRNTWTNMAIVADLTGSMSPYTGQLLVWLRLNTIPDRVKQFVFFNDGDMTPDSRKIIGNTGGIYQVKTEKFEEVEKLAYKTMSNGCGGDAPENNIEALSKAIDFCPECNNIVLIADNWAPVKDISLLYKIKKPVKVILCGSDIGINTQYLDLARNTGGSLHTIESDLTDLMRLNEGQTIIIRGKKYKIQDGKFILN